MKRKAGEVNSSHEEGDVRRGKTIGAEWWLSLPGFNLAVLLPKSLKKITKNVETNEELLYNLFKWDQYSVTIEYIWIFNIYSAGKYLMLIEVDSLDLMSTIAEFCIYIAVEFV